jgi:hypothetical protein
MSQPTPMSRAMMQTLKAERDEEIRQAQIKRIVNDLYKKAVDHASSGQGTSYNYPIPIGHFPSTQEKSLPMKFSKSIITCPAPYKRSSDSFYLENMSDILTSLQCLFPECSLSHSIMAKGTDGKLYDVAKLDESVLPFVDRALDQSYIVIDWS